MIISYLGARLGFYTEMTARLFRPRCDTTFMSAMDSPPTKSDHVPSIARVHTEYNILDLRVFLI